MRLSETHRALLKKQFADDFGEDCELYLFGSRVDDNARGGDVDLLLRSPRAVENRAWRAASAAAHAQRLVDGRKVDVVLLDPETTWQPIHTAALAKGILL